MTRGRWIAVSLVVALLLAGTVAIVVRSRLAGSSHRPNEAVTVAPSQSPIPSPGQPAGQPVYVHYYLWWTPQHWKGRLGPAYPYTAAEPPVPGKTDATGCNPQVSYPGSQIVDVPTEGLYDQGQLNTFTHHVDLAWRAGIRGFMVSWQGNGSAAQSPGSSGYDSRLDLLVQAVDTYNAARGSDFRLGLALAAFGNYDRPAHDVIGDLTYFRARYGQDPAFRNPYDPKPMVMWLDSRKYSRANIGAVSAAVRPQVYLLGDETTQSWHRDADFLDGASYYWSTENPWSNPQAGRTVTKLAEAVRAQGKRWFAPFIAGYDKQLLGGSCVPRHGTETLSKVWQMNSASRPDGWFGISWNEIVENTHLEPSRAYGTRYLDQLSLLIRGQG